MEMGHKGHFMMIQTSCTFPFIDGKKESSIQVEMTVLPGPLGKDWVEEGEP